MNPSVSDHSSIVIRCNNQVNLHPRPFRFFPNIMDHLQFQEILHVVWLKEGKDKNIKTIWRKLKNLNYKLSEINAYMASHEQRLCQAREKLDIVQS